ncbi:MAG TPA: DsbA family protein [Solirubrobacteraceae bacterium]|jgi:2-hydroxychromene-2-carboxylate isomerase|nr:DsbA family protein [Solirubrobacteraceae bacterium]
MAGSSTAEAAFYFDLASPLAYLAAESILQALPGPVEWRPVLARELSPSAAAFAARCEHKGTVWRENVERQAHALGLQPLHWPADFPFDSESAMRVATYAKSIGRTVPFAQAAFRQAFAAGNSLAQTDNVLIAAAACEMHPAAVLKGAELFTIREQLAQATADAAAAGVSDVPAVRVGKRVFVGASALEQAEAAMRWGASALERDEAAIRLGASPLERDEAAT